jgi:hypothetical protein
VIPSHVFMNMYAEFARRAGLSPEVGRAYEEKLADAMRIFREGKWTSVRRLF